MIDWNKRNGGFLSPESVYENQLGNLSAQINVKDKEIERLNNKNEELLTLYTTEREVKDYYKNIINELEKRLISDKKIFEDVYKKSHLSEEEFKKQYPYTIGSYDHSVEMLGKLQELKGSDK